MFNSKENIPAQTRSNYIRYLCQEGKRKGIDKNPQFYYEVIKFLKTDEGQDGLNKFSQIDPWRLGIEAISVNHVCKKAFKL